MSNRILRDSARRALASSLEIKRNVLLAISQDRMTPLSIRYRYSLLLSLLPRSSSKTRIKNRCIITGRGRSVYRKFRLSRIMFRELASYGQIPGVKKASW